MIRKKNFTDKFILEGVGITLYSWIELKRGYNNVQTTGYSQEQDISD